MTPGRAALVGLMDRYLRGLLDPFISLLEVHKLMYFMQEAGEPLRLRLSKGPYGPYAENLRHVLIEHARRSPRPGRDISRIAGSRGRRKTARSAPSRRSTTLSSRSTRSKRSSVRRSTSSSDLAFSSGRHRPTTKSAAIS